MFFSFIVATSFEIHEDPDEEFHLQDTQAIVQCPLVSIAAKLSSQPVFSYFMSFVRENAHGMNLIIEISSRLSSLLIILMAATRTISTAYLRANWFVMIEAMQNAVIADQLKISLGAAAIRQLPRIVQSLINVTLPLSFRNEIMNGAC